MEDGRRLSARQVVLAVEAPAAREFLTPLDPASAARIPTEAASSVGAAFALRTPLYRGRTILLNADPGSGERPRVDLLCQTTNVTRPGAVEGPHILLATSVTTGGVPGDGLVDAVGALVRRWAPGYDWAGLARADRRLRAPLRPVPAAAGRAPRPARPAHVAREPDPGGRSHPAPLHRGRGVERRAGRRDRDALIP